MYSQFPGCGGAQSEPQPGSSKSAQNQNPWSQYQNVDFTSFIDSFLKNSNGANPFLENLAKTFMGQTPTDPCTKTNATNSVSTKDDIFEIKLDVTNFTQEEISIRVQDNSIFIEGKHEEKEDQHGFVSRQFTRRFVLPEGIILEKMFSEMKHGNILVITAPRQVKPIIPQNSIPIKIEGLSEIPQD